MSAISGCLLFVVIIYLLRFQVEGIKGAFQLDISFRHEMEIDGCCFYGCVAKESADRIQISSLVERVGGKGMTKGMNAAVFGYAGFFLAL